MQAKKLVMQASMSGEVNALGYRLNAISEVNRHTRDFTLNSLTRALVEVIAFFPVYRTYTRGGGWRSVTGGTWNMPSPGRNGKIPPPIPRSSISSSGCCCSR